MEARDNLVKVHRLKVESLIKNEFEGAPQAGDIKLRNAGLGGLAADNQFLSGISDFIWLPGNPFGKIDCRF